MCICRVPARAQKKGAAIDWGQQQGKLSSGFGLRFQYGVVRPFCHSGIRWSKDSLSFLLVTPLGKCHPQWCATLPGICHPSSDFVTPPLTCHPPYGCLTCRHDDDGNEVPWPLGQISGSFTFGSQWKSNSPHVFFLLHKAEQKNKLGIGLHVTAKKGSSFGI